MGNPLSLQDNEKDVLILQGIIIILKDYHLAI